MARKTKAEAQATRELLLDAAEQAFVENGVSRTSLESIARRAGVTRGAIYWHFHDKGDLFEAMLERVRPPLGDLVDALSRESGGDPVQTLRRLCRFGLDNLTGDARPRRVYTILFHRCEFVGEINPAVARRNQIVTELLGLLEQQFERARELGSLNPTIPPAVAASALHAYIAGLYSEYLRNPAHCDLDRHSEAFIDSFFDWVTRRVD